MRARDVMSSPAITVTPETPIKDAARILVERGINALPVIADGRLVGIVTEEDLVLLEAVPDPRLHVMVRPARGAIPHAVGEVMTRRVHTTYPDADVAELARMLYREGIKQAPVVEHDQVVGVIARRDTLRALARPDAEVQTELTTMLADVAPLIGRFDATVRDGVAILDGQRDARDAGARRLAERIARCVPGVLSVAFRDEPLTASSR